MYGLLDPQDKWGQLGLLLTQVGGGIGAAGGQGLTGIGQIGAGIGQGMQGFAQAQQANQMAQYRAQQIASEKRRQEQEDLVRQAQARIANRLTSPGGSMARNPQMASAAPGASAGAPPFDMTQAMKDPAFLQDVIAASGGDPLKAMAILQKEPPKPMSVAPGAALVDPRTGKPVYVNPQTDRPTEYDKLVADAQGNDPYRRKIAQDILSRRGQAPSTTMTVNTGEKGLTELDVKTIGEYEANLRKSRSLLPDLDRLEAAVRMFPTGMGGSQVLAFKQAAERLGWKLEGTSEGEIIQSIQSRLAPAMRPEGSGSSSDRDVQMFLDSLPNLFKTQGGNLKVISHLRRIAGRQQQEAAFMRQYFRENGNKLDGVYEAMDKKLGPLFPRPKTEEEMRKLSSGEVFMAPDGTMRVVP
jgi:hypothetical protein